MVLVWARGLPIPQSIYLHIQSVYLLLQDVYLVYVLLYIGFWLVSQAVYLNLQAIDGLLVAAYLNIELGDVGLVVLDVHLQAVYLVHVDVCLARLVLYSVYVLSQLVYLGLISSALLLSNYPDLLLQLRYESDFGLL